MIGGPCDPLLPGALEARGVCSSSRVVGEGGELDSVERHLAGDALGHRHGVHRE
jgi:hypothetical protein